MLYRTALLIVLRFTVGRVPVVAGLPLLALRSALLEWSRAAELSCDRAATLVARDPLVTCRTLMALAGGAASRDLNLDAFLRQASDSMLRDAGENVASASERLADRFDEWLGKKNDAD